ncbi:MAG: replicative DNA helicase [Fimbriimonas sp.]
MRIDADELTPLNNLEAEMSVLGSMILSDRIAVEITSLLEEEDFYRPAHRLIYRALHQLTRVSKPIDFVTLKEELISRGNLLDVGGEDYLVQIATYVPSPANARFYAQIVQDKATLRRLEEAAHKIVGIVHDSSISEAEEKVDKAEQAVYDVGGKQLGKFFTHVRSLTKEFIIDLDRIIETGEPAVGTRTGFYDLDSRLTGLYPGELMIVAARPSMGKTTLVVDIARNVAQQQVGNVAIFSLEMTGIQLVRRMITSMSGVSSYELKKSEITTDTYNKLVDAVENLYSLPIYIDDSSEVNSNMIKAKCRRLKSEGGLSLVVVDYLQLMRGNRRTENRVQEISEIARGLKGLAKDLEVPVIALSQLNRSVELRDNKRPNMSDIRESGSIEAEADVVMLLYRDRYYKDRENPAEADKSPDRVETAEINIAKHRNGEPGLVLLGFEPNYVRFRNLEQASQKDYLANLRREFEAMHSKRGRSAGGGGGMDDG